MVTGGGGGHEAGGMSEVNEEAASAGATAGSGVLIAVRFPRADMSTQHRQQTGRLHVPPSGEPDCNAKLNNHQRRRWCDKNVQLRRV